MVDKYVTWQLTAQEAAHAMPVLQWVHPGLRDAPAPRLALIRRLAARCGVRDGALRTALSRACAAGSLQTEASRYRLGPQSVEETEAARALLDRRRGYALAVAPEGAGTDLPALREVFERLGFRPLQRSVWIGARTADDRLSAALARVGLTGAATVFQADEVDVDARTRLGALWRLEDRIERLREFKAALTGYLTEPGAPEEAAWRCVQAAPVWYRVAVREEPPFPLDLIGPDYPLDPLNTAWRAHLEAMTPQLLALWTA